MASTFHALPLPSGEAFLLKTDHGGRNWTILVDSGMRYAKKHHPLAKAIRCAEPGLERIDIAVCTHQDADHANGFRTFADAWYGSGGSIGEFWLPGRWAAALPDILLAPESVIANLHSGAIEVADQFFERRIYDEPFPGETFEERIRAVVDEEQINQHFSEVDSASEMHGREQAEGDEAVARSLGMSVQRLNGYRADLEESDGDIGAELLRQISYRDRYLFEWDYPFFRSRSWLAGVLFNRAIDTAKSIQAIASSAANLSIPIRWFDFGIFETGNSATGGNSGLLEPVNSVELIRPPSAVDAASLLFCLNLTRQNVESLVFHRPETEHEPAALFLGDSRLAFGMSNPHTDFSMPRSAPKRPILITAPHHGSRVNDHAYLVIDNWLGSSLERYYVRNGGHWKQKLDEILNQPNRRCAKCHQCHGGKWKQRVSVHSNGHGQWAWSSCTGATCSTPKRCPQ